MPSELKIARGFALPLELVTEATAIVATRGAGKSSTSAVVVEEIFDLGVQSVIFDRTGVYWGLRSNKTGTGPGLGIYVLGGPHGDAPLEATAGKLIADLVVDSGHSFVLDFSDFSKSATIKFAADFLERIYDRKARSRTTTLLVIDEAHFYAPQTPRGGFKGDSARLMGAMEDVVGLGRSRGLGVVMTTQRTQSLNKAVLDLIETMFVMRMLSPRARDAVKDWIREKQEDDREGVIATLESLPDGTAWVWSPLRGILQKVAVRRIKTFDSYATPKAGEVRAEPTVRKELDMKALGAEIAATVERAKESDPGELRKRLREAEAKLAAQREPDAREAARALRESVLPDPPPGAEWELGGWMGATPEAPWPRLRLPEVAPVEVPVLTAEESERLFRLAKATEGLTSQGTVIQDLGRELIEVIEARAQAMPAPPSPPPVPSPRPAARPAAPPPPTAPARARAPENGGITAAQQRVLDALAWYEAMQIATPSRIQTGFVAGYKVGKKGGGTFAQVIADMTRDGLLTQPRPGLLTLTEHGRALAVDPGLPGTNEALHHAVLQRLGESEARILRVLIECYPGSMSRIELGERTGYMVTSKGGGTFAQLLANLKQLGLIDYPERGQVGALDVLFPMG